MEYQSIWTRLERPSTDSWLDALIDVPVGVEVTFDVLDEIVQKELPEWEVVTYCLPEWAED